MNTLSVTEGWENFKIPAPVENDYGLDWPPGLSQLSKELKCFSLARCEQQVGDIEDAFSHALRIVQLLWPDHSVSLKRENVLNTYFLDCLHDLCNFRHLAITGPASSGKTYTMAVFFLICFYSAPDRTTVLISTTARQDAERRVWGDVKKLHRTARFTENSLPEIGEIIEYAGCIVYNPAKIAGKDFNVRDFRHGVMVVPTGGDSSGDEALNKIMGTKNAMVYWGVDEGPAMPAEIMSPRANLAANPFFQFVMIGNASYKTDPHGRACEPKDGWGSISPLIKRWRGKTLDVLFLHGEQSPNDIFDCGAIRKSDLKYPTLSNKFMREEIAEYAGNGDIEYGKSTQYYWRFAIGFWMGSDDQQTVLSEGFVKTHKAHLPPETWGPTAIRVFVGHDPGFTSGGDANAVMFFHFGFTVKGKPQLVIESDSIEVRPAVSDEKDYARASAEQIVLQCKKRGQVDLQDFGMDVSGDGGISSQEIEKAFGLTGIQLLSSLKPSSMEKYANRVTQYWMTIRDLISTGMVRGFNINSKYAKDLFERRFTSEQKTFRVEKKKDMKKRIGRSPDNGDAFSYGAYMVWSSGVLNMVTPGTDDRRVDGPLVTKYYRYFDKRRKEEEFDSEEDFDFVGSLED